MNLKEFEDKYGSGKTIPINAELVNGYDPGKIISIPGEKFQANLGEFIKDYYEHLSMGCFKRAMNKLSYWEWQTVEKKFRKALDICLLSWSDTTLTR